MEGIKFLILQNEGKKWMTAGSPKPPNQQTTADKPSSPDITAFTETEMSSKYPQKSATEFYGWDNNRKIYLVLIYL